MHFTKRFVATHIMFLICRLSCASQALAVDITYQGTTVSANVTGLGAVSQVYNYSSYPNIFYVEMDGYGGGMPIGASGPMDLTLTVTGTDGWGSDVSTPDIQVPQVTASLSKFFWNEQLNSFDTYYMKLSSIVLKGNTISGATTYSLAHDNRYPAKIDVDVYQGNSKAYSFEIKFILPYEFFNGLFWNLDSLGGPGDNQDTEFDGGGAGSCSCQGLPRYFVNTSFLNLAVEDTDLIYQSYGQQVALRRAWNMLPSRSGMFGNGWTFAYESRLIAQAYAVGGVQVSLGSGQVLSYAVSGSQGTGTVTVNYAGTGRQPVLTGYINQSTGIGYYTLLDKERKLTSRYDYLQSGSDGSVYRLTSVTDRNGNALTLTYDGNGRLTQLTDASNRQVTFTIDGNGRCAGFTTIDGHTASFAYDGAGNLTQTTDLAGNVSTYVYDAQNYLTSMTAAGKTTAFTYATGAAGKYMASVTDALGKTTTYAFDGNGTRVTEPGGGTRSYLHDKGMTTRVTNPMGQSVTTTYNDNRLPVSILDADFRQTSFAYDASGNLIKVTDPVGKETAYAYDGNWNRISRTDPLSQTWTYVYDARDNLIRTTSPLGAVTGRTVNALGLVTRLSLPDGATYDYSYDQHGNLTAIADPLGNTTSFAYDAAGLNRTSRTDPRQYTTTYQYDANRRLTATHLPDASTILYGYDCCALSSVTNGGGHLTSFARDALLRITGTTDPLGHFTQLTYDDDGFMTASTDPLGRTTSFGRDTAHRVTSVANPLGKQVRFALNASGKPTSLTNERGKTTTIGYDGRGLLYDMSDPLFHNFGAIARDDLGRVSSVTAMVGATYPPVPPPLPVSKVVSFAYDADGRLVTKKHNASTFATFDWNANGLLNSVTDATGTRTSTRDRAGRISHIAFPDGKALDLAYDYAGNVASMTYPGGLVVSSSHDGLGRPTEVSFAGQSLSLTYDATGQLAGETRSNGVVSAYGYDAAGRLVSLSHKKGATVIAELVYTRDVAGQITSASGVWPLSPRLQGKAATAVYDNADQIGTWQSDSYHYNTVGNLTTIRGAKTFDAVYDNENRPTSLTLGGKTRTYTYDGLGNRVRLQVGTTTRNLHHDHLGRLVFETDGSGQVTVNYLYAGDRLVASGTTAGGFVFYHQDKTGSTLALTNASGAKVGAYAYSPYGAVAGHSGTATTPFTYAGIYGVMDEGDDLFFMRNRYYDAATGRFIQRDPIGFAGGTNLFRYASNNPVSRIDPSGLFRDEGLGSSEDYNEALHNGSLRDTRIDDRINEAMSSADLALSSLPGLPGKIYTEAKCMAIGVSGGGLNNKGVGDDIFWELVKMVSGPVGGIMDWMDAENEKNVRLVRETENELRKNANLPGYDKKGQIKLP